jgi:hypothetical protein
MTQRYLHHRIDARPPVRASGGVPLHLFVDLPSLSDAFQELRLPPCDALALAAGIERGLGAGPGERVVGWRAGDAAGCVGRARSALFFFFFFFFFFFPLSRSFDADDCCRLPLLACCFCFVFVLFFWGGTSRSTPMLSNGTGGAEGDADASRGIGECRVWGVGNFCLCESRLSLSFFC